MEAMFFIEYVGTLQGSKIEKEVKDYCRKKFHNRLCTAKGRILIYGMVVEFAQKLHQANPKANLPAIVLNGSDGDLCFPAKNATDNFRILSFKRCVSVIHDPDETSVTVDDEEEGGNYGRK